MGHPLGKKNITSKRVKMNKEMFLKEYSQSYNLNAAIEAGTFSRKTYYNYMEQDEVFFEAVNDIREANLSTVENALMTSILKGNIHAIMFYLKARGGEKWKIVEKTQVEQVEPITITYLMPS